jgi:hypothetical protein
LPSPDRCVGKRSRQVEIERPRVERCRGRCALANLTFHVEFIDGG